MLPRRKKRMETGEAADDNGINGRLAGAEGDVKGPMTTKKTTLRAGFTTGTAAAAAAKAAILVMTGGGDIGTVTVTLPDGEELVIPVALAEKTKTGARAMVIKGRR